MQVFGSVPLQIDCRCRNWRISLTSASLVYSIQ